MDESEDSIQMETFPQPYQTRESIAADRLHAIEREQYQQQRKAGKAAGGAKEDRTDEARELDDAWRELKFFIGNRDSDGLPADNYEEDKSTPRYRLAQALKLADATNLDRIPFRDACTAFEKVQLKKKTGIDEKMLHRLF